MERVPVIEFKMIMRLLEIRSPNVLMAPYKLRTNDHYVKRVVPSPHY